MQQLNKHIPNPEIQVADTNSTNSNVPEHPPTLLATQAKVGRLKMWEWKM